MQGGAVEKLPGARGTAGRVHAAGVGDDLQVRLLDEMRRETFEDVKEVGGESGVGLALLLQCQDGHRQLSEVFEGEIVELTGLGEADWGVSVVAPEAAAVA